MSKINGGDVRGGIGDDSIGQHGIGDRGISDHRHRPVVVDYGIVEGIDYRVGDAGRLSSTDQEIDLTIGVGSPDPRVGKCGGNIGGDDVSGYDGCIRNIASSLGRVKRVCERSEVIRVGGAELIGRESDLSKLVNVGVRGAVHIPVVRSIYHVGDGSGETDDRIGSNHVGVLYTDTEVCTCHSVGHDIGSVTPLSSRGLEGDTPNVVHGDPVHRVNSGRIGGDAFDLIARFDEDR